MKAKAPKKATIAICVGHSRRIGNRFDGGAVSVNGTSERNRNISEAGFLQSALSRVRSPDGSQALNAFTVNVYGGESYIKSMRWLAKELKRRGATHAIELHFNSATSDNVSGHEWLHHASSSKGKLLAEHFDSVFRQAHPLLAARGLKPIERGGRGDGFLRLTHCPSLIAEPFFGSNQKNWDLLGDPLITANLYSEAIVNFLKEDGWIAGVSEESEAQDTDPHQEPKWKGLLKRILQAWFPSVRLTIGSDKFVLPKALSGITISASNLRDG